MLEKPNLPDELILAHLREAYDISATELTFLPLGADMGTAVYRVEAEDGKVYFLKLRKGFEEITVTVPLFLKSQGVEEIIAPIETRSKQGWVDFGEYKMILYPFIEGSNGFEVELSDEERRTLGIALKKIHSARLPSELSQHIPQETFSHDYREAMRSFLAQMEEKIYEEKTAAKLAAFIKSKRIAIDHLIEQAESFASEIRSQALEFVLCHTDFHGGNILACRVGQLPHPTSQIYIVDWDAPLFAPKERDLMFIGGGIDGIWKTKQDESIFYDGYGETEINPAALAYYRYERIVVDLVEYCKQLLLSDEGGADREQAYRWFTSNFDPGGTFEIAENTYKQV